jgi:hypothetical protein
MTGPRVLLAGSARTGPSRVATCHAVAFRERVGPAPAIVREPAALPWERQ